MKQLIVLILLSWMTLCYSQDDSGTCVMYGQCDVDSVTKFEQSCVYNGPPIPLDNSTAFDILKDLCPSLPIIGVDSICCDASEIVALKTQMDGAAMLFKRCPSCYQNLANVFCHMICSPFQSTFMKVTKSEKNPDKKDTVKDLSYYITEKYADGLFANCKNVQMSITNMPAIEVSCGSYGKDCNPHRWLKYMGGHDPSPYQITFNFETADNVTVNETVYYPMNDTIKLCSEVPKKGSVACSCVDCPCTPVPLPPEPKPFTLLGLPGMWTIMIFVFFFMFLIIITGFVCSNFYPKKDEMELLLESEEVTKYNRQPQPSSWIERFGTTFEENLISFFTQWGIFCASYPVTILLIGIAFITMCSCGFFYFTIQTNPVEIWSGSHSQARLEKEYFDSHFGPFYRTEQVIITRNNGTPVYGTNLTFSEVFDREFLHEVLELQTELTSLWAENDNKTVHFEDICFAPVHKRKCMIQSVVNWFQNNATHLDYYKDTDDYLEFLKNCTSNPVFLPKTGLQCFGDYGGPVFPYVALGGVQDGNYENATALILTFMVNNFIDSEDNANALAWEQKFIEHMKNYSNPNMTISFSTERSIEDELNRESRSDIRTIAISYFVMFAYVSIALGQYHSISSLFLKSKIVLGLGGVLIVLASVASSLGISSYLDVPSTLIIIEVIPFLALAVGVDNIFIIVQAYHRSSRYEVESREEHIGRVIGQIAPSLLLASLCETSCFFLGAMSHMPAVHKFALYSGLALAIDFLLQITCFVALLSLDAKREESKRFDVCCCIKSKEPESEEKPVGVLYKIFQNCYAPFLMRDPVRAFFLVIFTGWVCSSVAVINKIEIGLDQKLSMPEDSYVLDYFKSLEQYLSVGPPVYFVVKSGLNYSDFDEQNALCSIGYCYRESLVTQISDASHYSNRSYIAHPPLDWLDTYFSWANDGDNCCKVYANDSSKFCPHTEIQTRCSECQITDSRFRPCVDKFNDFLVDFLDDSPTPECGAGGHAAFSNAVQIKKVTNDTLEVGASHFMTYHTVLKKSEDYTAALRSARNIAKNITHTFRVYGMSDPNIDVFPYSIFYVFYEQYLTMIHSTVLSLSVSLIDIFVVTLVIMGLDFHSSFILIFTIMLIVLNMMGLMYWWNIALNAVSLVNLVMAVGISVEFCSHIIRAFAFRPYGNRVQRAQYALANMGSSVLSGITLTKFGGIIVLAFSKSQIFQVFYFRMYLGIVLIGAAHGLIFLPVLLSVVGPPPKHNIKGYISKEERKGKQLSESEVFTSGTNSGLQTL